MGVTRTSDDEARRRSGLSQLLHTLRRVPLRDVRKVPAALRAADDRIGKIVSDASRKEYLPEGLVRLDRHSKALLELANDLAADPSCDDEAAAAEIVRRAGSRKDALRVAEINSRASGYYRDFEVENRAQRLLEAAASRQPVRQVTEVDQERFRVVEQFAALSENLAWEKLVVAQPALGDLAAQAIAGAFGNPLDLMKQSGASDERVKAAQEHQDRIRQLVRSLDGLVGPRSSSSDVLIRSTYARVFAEEYLYSLRREAPSRGDSRR